MTESYNNYVDILSKIDLSKFKIVEHKTKEPIKIGICQLTDTHFNTLLNESESLGNSYNFDIASKRLKKFITETINNPIAFVNPSYFGTRTFASEDAQ